MYRPLETFWEYVDPESIPELVSHNTANIIYMNKVNNSLDGRVYIVETDIKNLQSQQSINTTDIATLKPKVEKNTQEILNNDSEILLNKNAIVTITKELEKSFETYGEYGVSTWEGIIDQPNYYLPTLVPNIVPNSNYVIYEEEVFKSQVDGSVEIDINFNIVSIVDISFKIMLYKNNNLIKEFVYNALANVKIHVNRLFKESTVKDDYLQIRYYTETDRTNITVDHFLMLFNYLNGNNAEILKSSKVIPDYTVEGNEELGINPLLKQANNSVPWSSELATSPTATSTYISWFTYNSPGQFYFQVKKRYLDDGTENNLTNVLNAHLTFTNESLEFATHDKDGVSNNISVTDLNASAILVKRQIKDYLGSKTIFNNINISSTDILTVDNITQYKYLGLRAQWGQIYWVQIGIGIKRFIFHEPIFQGPLPKIWNIKCEIKENQIQWWIEKWESNGYQDADGIIEQVSLILSERV